MTKEIIKKIFSALAAMLSILYSLNVYGQDSLKYSHFYWAAIGVGTGVTSTVPNYAGINAGICAAIPFKKVSVLIDGSVTSPNRGAPSLYSASSASLNIGKIFKGKHFWAGGYIGPAFIFGDKNDGTPFKTAGLNIDIPLMLRFGPNLAIGAVPFTNYGIGYNASGIRLSLVICGDLL